MHHCTYSVSQETSSPLLLPKLMSVGGKEGKRMHLQRRQKKQNLNCFSLSQNTLVNERTEIKITYQLLQ
jgi:hypothetical protein